MFKSKLIKICLIQRFLLVSGLIILGPVTTHATDAELTSGSHFYRCHLKIADENSGGACKDVDIEIIGTHHWYPFSGMALPDGLTTRLSDFSTVANETTAFLHAHILHRNLLLMRHLPSQSDFFRTYADRRHGLSYTPKDEAALSFLKNHLVKKISPEFFSQFGIQGWCEADTKDLLSQRDHFDLLPPGLVYETAYALVICKSLEYGLLSRCAPEARKITLDESLEAVRVQEFMQQNQPLQDAITLDQDIQKAVIDFYSGDAWRFEAENTCAPFLTPSTQNALDHLTFCSLEDRERVTDAIKVYKMLKNQTKKMNNIRADKKTYIDHVLQYDRGFFKDAPAAAQIEERNLSWLKKPLLEALHATRSHAKALILFGADHLITRDHVGILNFLMDRHLSMNEDFWRQHLGEDTFNLWRRIQVTSLERFVPSTGYRPLLAMQ
ncbi:MAG: hypothetical protein ACK5O7_06970 [Holosporales bacterium]